MPDEDWESQADDLLDRLDPEYYYGTSREYPGWVGATREEYMELGDEYGYERLVHNLELKEELQEAYWDGDWDYVAELYEDIDQDYPDWFWGYHGVAS